MSLIQFLHFEKYKDKRGSLVALESMKNIPFEIKRVYYMADLDSNSPRGFHAHKELKQIAFCLSGNCRFVFDNGIIKEECELRSDSIAIIIPEMIWHEMHDFSKDCILVVLASDHYNEDDYLRNYNEFIKITSNA